MGAGVSLVEIHNPLLFIDGDGNLVLNTKGKLAEQVADSNVPGFAAIGAAFKVTISNVAGGTQYYSLISFQVADVAGTAVAGVFNLDVSLSDAATGIGLPSHSPSGGSTFTVGTTIVVYTAAEAFRVQTDATGKATMQVIDSSKTAYYPVAVIGNRTIVGAQLTTASYHA